MAVAPARVEKGPVLANMIPKSMTGPYCWPRHAAPGWRNWQTQGA